MNSVPSSRFSKRVKSTARTLELKEAIVASFVLDARAAQCRLAGFDEADWLSVMWWLDISGLAIYSLDLTRRISAGGLIPPSVEAALAQRLANNRVRMEALRRESHAVASNFGNHGIPYALLKGMTLAPESVTESALRCQTDLDFLVANSNAEQAIDCINQLGYKLRVKSGDTLEFRAGATPLPDIANLYAVHAQRALELHLLPESSGNSNLLTRTVTRDFSGLQIEVLSPADILVQQALHLLKHLCGEHTRLSWILEFWRHVNARRHDQGFWHVVESNAAITANGDLAMAIAFWAAGEVFGAKVCCDREQWKAQALPVRVKLWLELYLKRLLMSDAVGSKLYALLRTEVPHAPNAERRMQDILLPRVLPSPILESHPDEGFADRWNRRRAEAEFFLRRLRFHLREGARFVFELLRWNRADVKEQR